MFVTAAVMDGGHPLSHLTPRLQHVGIIPAYTPILFVVAEIIIPQFQFLRQITHQLHILIAEEDGLQTQIW